MHPKNKIERVYIVASKLDISLEGQSQLTKGIELDDGSRVKGKIQRLDKSGGLIYWRVVLKEGKNHEVKRIFKSLGSRVIHLHRHSFAGFNVDNISPGKYHILKDKDIQKMMKNNPL
jgi:23S rRNA pseudouridine2605 synthase